MKRIKKILVTGSRDWTDRPVVENAIKAEIDGTDPYGFMLIQGECPYGGADLIAKKYALSLPMLVLSVPAQWDVLGKAAGPTRNNFMLDLNPHVVLAFPLPGSNGTVGCIKEAERRGIPFKVFQPETG